MNDVMTTFYFILQDAFVMDLNKNILSVLHDAAQEQGAKLEDFDIAVSKDCHGINSGSFLVRNSVWGR